MVVRDLGEKEMVGHMSICDMVHKLVDSESIRSKIFNIVSEVWDYLSIVCI